MINIDRKYIYIAVAAVAIGFAALLLTRCGKDGSAQIEMGPAETTEAFCRAIGAGNIKAAKNLCDTVRMKTYLESVQHTMGEAASKDSTVTDIACSILKDMTFSVSDIKKEGDLRIVFYRIGLSEDNIKDKIAKLVKEEDIWRITAITDGH